MSKEFNILFKNTSMLAGTRILQFLTGLIRVKLIAFLTGTMGIAIVDQFTFITNKLSNFTTVGTAEAFVKQLSSNNKEDVGEVMNSAIKSYLLVISGFVVLCSLLSIYLSEYLTNFVFGEVQYVKYFYLAILTFPLLVLGSVPFSILKAYKNVKTISKARIYIVTVQSILAIPMIYFFKLKGALIYIPFSYAIDLLFLHHFVTKFYYKKYKISFSTVLKAPLLSVHLKELFLFSGFGITVGLYAIISDVVCRGIIISKLGIEAIGIYSPIILFTSLFTGFVLPALSTYLYPKFCELSNTKQISDIINSALRFSSLLLIPFLFIGIPFQNEIIELFFSKDFKEASNYLPFHFLGLIFFVWRYVFAQSLTPTGRIVTHGVFRSLHFSLDILITFFTVKYYGLYGWMLKYLVSSLVFFIVYFIYSKKHMGFVLEAQNLLLMLFLSLGSLFIVVFQTFIKFNTGTIILGLILLLTSFLFLNKSEKEFLKKIRITKS